MIWQTGSIILIVLLFTLGASLQTTGDYTRESTPPPSQQPRSSSVADHAGRAASNETQQPPAGHSGSAAELQQQTGSTSSSSQAAVRAEGNESLGRVQPAQNQPQNPPSMGQSNRLDLINQNEQQPVHFGGKNKKLMKYYKEFSVTRRFKALCNHLVSYSILYYLIFTLVIIILCLSA